ncbi:hypothetical protein MKW98_003607 [Papaver atlanticum]|uniref:Uncharacterized protein n=1 Tax=Papaver atlanticum TaxID=357466 RepID=A0AAD4SID1_9MAGN|nr:hypothetical protein MKW98_003607 [Papaver atlanticum]
MSSDETRIPLKQEIPISDPYLADVMNPPREEHECCCNGCFGCCYVLDLCCVSCLGRCYYIAGQLGLVTY